MRIPHHGFARSRTSPLSSQRFFYARQICSLISGGLGTVATSPINAALLVARRGPRPAREALSWVLSKPAKLLGAQGVALRALALILCDRHPAARQLLKDTDAPGRLLDALRAAVYVTDDPAVLHPAAKARYLWELGDLPQAITAQPRRYLSRWWKGEASLLANRGLPPLAISSSDRALHRKRQAEHRRRGTIAVVMAITSSFPHTRSGYAQRTHGLLRAAQMMGTSASGTAVYCRAVTRPGYPATIGRWAQQACEIVDGVAYTRYLPWIVPAALDRFVAMEAEALVSYAVETGASVIHATSDWARGEAGLRAARALEIPFVYECRGEREKTWLASLPSHLRARAQESFRYTHAHGKELMIAQQADAVVTLSETHKQALVDRGVRADRITVIPNGIPADALRLPEDQAVAAQRQADIRRIHGLPAQSFLLGTITSVVPYEGLETLIEALPLLLESSDCDYHLLIAGDGTARRDLEQLVEELDLVEHVTFTGQVSPSNAEDLYDAVDLFCLPRRNTAVTRTITPLKSVLALARGIPVLASDLPALREITPDAHPELLVPPEDPQAWAGRIRCLANTLRHDPDEARRLRRDCSRFAGTRTWEAAAGKLHAIYLKLGDATSGD